MLSSLVAESEEIMKMALREFKHLRDSSVPSQWIELRQRYERWYRACINLMKASKFSGLEDFKKLYSNDYPDLPSIKTALLLGFSMQNYSGFSDRVENQVAILQSLKSMLNHSRNKAKINHMKELPNNIIDEDGKQIPIKQPRLSYFTKKAKMIIVILIATLAIIAGVITNVSTIISFFNIKPKTRASNSAPIDSSTPTLLISNAFKAGYSITQMQDAATSEQLFIIWKNRTEAHLEGLDIDPAIMQDATHDSELTPNETILLRDQIYSKIEARHGVGPASTFVLGADLVPTTRAFESYLTDREYRQRLAESNVSILQLGFSINSNINEAVFPDKLKQNWVSIYFKTYVGDGTPEQLERIKTFRESILDYFY